MAKIPRELSEEEVRIRVVKKEEPLGSCIYAMGDTSPRPTFQLEGAQLTYEVNGINHIILPGFTATITNGSEVTAKAYIRNIAPTPSTAFKAMLMLTQVQAGEEYVYKKSDVYACYEDHSVYFDVKFAMPTEDIEVRLRAYHTNSRDCFQDISASFHLKAANGTPPNEGPPIATSIICSTTPSDAMIYLDGMDTGLRTQTTVATTVGQHYILYRKAPNYINYEVVVTAVKGEAIKVVANLEEGMTAKGYWEDIKDVVIPVEVAIESQCARPWCLENMGKWIKTGVGLDYPFTYRGTNFCILLDTSAGNPLPEFIYCPFWSVRFETEGPSSYAIPKAIATESIRKLLQEEKPEGTALLSKSDIVPALYSQKPSTFGIAVMNTGEVSAEYKVSVIFAGIDTAHEEVFESEWSEAIAPNEMVTLPVGIELLEGAIPAAA